MAAPATLQVMGATFSIVAANLTVTAAKTLIFLRPGTTRPLELLRVEVSHSGAATSAPQRVQIVSQVTAFPTLTSFTPLPFDGLSTSVITGGTAGAAGTCGINASAEGAGAKTVLYDAAFNAPIGWAWVPGPADSIILPTSWASGIGIYLASTPTTTTGWHATLLYREV